jgi:hypothetical protein
MSSESMCQVARSCVDVGSFHTCLVLRFTIFTVSVRNTTSYIVLNVNCTAVQEAVLCSVQEFGLSGVDMQYEVLICMKSYLQWVTLQRTVLPIKSGCYNERGGYYGPKYHACAHAMSGLPALIRASVITFVIVFKVQL